MAKKILIVEDNEANRKLMKDILKFYGYSIVEATDGKEGIDAAKAHTPDVILMDIQMPVMNGYEAIKILKNDPNTRQIKIVAITSFAMVGDKEKILQAGADDYITKPINTRELPKIIKRILDVKDEY